MYEHWFHRRRQGRFHPRQIFPHAWHRSYRLLQPQHPIRARSRRVHLIECLRGRRRRPLEERCAVPHRPRREHPPHLRGARPRGYPREDFLPRQRRAHDSRCFPWHRAKRSLWLFRSSAARHQRPLPVLSRVSGLFFYPGRAGGEAICAAQPARAGRAPRADHPRGRTRLATTSPPQP